MDEDSDSEETRNNLVTYLHIEEKSNQLLAEQFNIPASDNKTNLGSPSQAKGLNLRRHIFANRFYAEDCQQACLVKPVEEKRQDQKASEWLFNLSADSFSDMESFEHDDQDQSSNYYDNVPSHLYSSFKVQNSKNNKIRTHYKCEYASCSKQFSQICNVKRHIMTHLQVKEFQCCKCTKKFSQKSNMQRHERNCRTGK